MRSRCECRVFVDDSRGASRGRAHDSSRGTGRACSRPSAWEGAVTRWLDPLHERTSVVLVYVAHAAADGRRRAAWRVDIVLRDVRWWLGEAARMPRPTSTQKSSRFTAAVCRPVEAIPRAFKLLATVRRVFRIVSRTGSLALFPKNPSQGTTRVDDAGRPANYGVFQEIRCVPVECVYAQCDLRVMNEVCLRDATILETTTDARTEVYKWRSTHAALSGADDFRVTARQE